MNRTNLQTHIQTALNALDRAEAQAPETFNETSAARVALRSALRELTPAPVPQPSGEPCCLCTAKNTFGTFKTFNGVTYCPDDAPMLIDGELKSIRDIFGDGAPLWSEVEPEPEPTPKADNCTLRAMRAAFATARDAGLDTTKAAEMKAALGHYFGAHFESRRQLTAAMWREVCAAIARRELAW